MLKIILPGVAALVVVFIVIVAMRPSDFTITRSITIAAPPADVFVHVNDLHNWEAWSPWAKLDPNAKNTFGGPAAGTGSAMSWAGNNKIGEGKMTITESRLGERIRFNLEFLKPFKANNTAEFLFKSQGNQTTVIWSMSGKSNFMFKAVGLFMNCDKMVGGQFEQGLAQLKSVAETTATKTQAMAI
jgi:uncharacterized protein YndB with AHSA1/START domain